MALLTFLTDFGLQDGYVGTMKGVVKGIAPDVSIVDLSHDIPPQNLDAAGFVLWNSYRYFPDGTVFVCVVDPGVGSGRPIVAVKTQRHYFVAPDNGLLGFVLAEEKSFATRLVENHELFRDQISQTFHGRDIFSPVGAHLASGLPFEEVGYLLTKPSPESVFQHINSAESAIARIVYVDHFGNLITNLRFNPGTGGRVVLNDISLQVHPSYAAVSVGEGLALAASHGLLEIAIRNGNAAETFGVGYGDTLRWYAE